MNNFSLNLEHLQARMVQTGHWLPTNILTKKKLIELSAPEFNNELPDVKTFIRKWFKDNYYHSY